MKNIILLYSEETQYQSGTKEYADNLQNLLQDRHRERDLRFHLIPLSDVSNAEVIKRDLKDKLTRYLQNNSSIHFNYTGGTKAMGIHVYQWLAEYAKEKNIPISFSYLDARTFQIVDDRDGRITYDLRDEISLNLEELIRLHGFKRNNETTHDQDLFNDVINKFKEFIGNQKLKDYFSHYKREIFTDEKGKLITSIKKLKSKIVEKNYRPEGTFLEVIKLMPEEYKLFNDDGSFKEPKNREDLERAIEFLDGKWLELYVYKVLRENLTDKNIATYVNWKIKKPGWERPGHEFELDVILIRGYQLVGISCTTSDRKYLCKSKGFEIFLRTRQIGGEEARAALVTRLSEVEKDEIQEELEIDTGGRKNILVLGNDDLREDILVRKIKDFIK